MSEVNHLTLEISDRKVDGNHPGRSVPLASLLMTVEGALTLAHAQARSRVPSATTEPRQATNLDARVRERINSAFCRVC